MGHRPGEFAIVDLRTSQVYDERAVTGGQVLGFRIWNLCKAAIDKYEASYDTEAENKASAKAEEYASTKIIDFNQFYRKSLRECCDEISPFGMGEIIYYLITYAFNDVQGWAEEMTFEKPGKHNG